MRFRYDLLAILSITGLCWGQLSRAAESDWPTFRGTDRTAVANDRELLQLWPEEGPQLVWQVDGIGRGYSSPAIAGDRIYTLGDSLPGAEDSDEYLICLDRATGDEIWKRKTGPAWNNGQDSWQSSRSTPTIDGDQIYAMTAYGKLICFDASGRERWSADLKDAFAGEKADGWGYSESVLIDGDRLICTPGGETNTMVALDKRSGDLIWNCSRSGDRGAGHASIVIADVGGTKVYVQTTGSGAMGVRARDGELLWTYDIDDTTAVIPTPVVRGDLVFFTAGYGRGGALLKQVPHSNGMINVEEVYGLNPKLQNKHGGVVLVGDYLYGDSGDSGTPFCADLLSGEIQWSGRGSGRKSASVAAADGCLYFRYSDGTMTLVKASPDSFEELGSFKVPGSGERPSWAHPVIAGGRLYLRGHDKLHCYDLTR